MFRVFIFEHNSFTKHFRCVYEELYGVTKQDKQSFNDNVMSTILEFSLIKINAQDSAFKTVLRSAIASAILV